MSTNSTQPVPGMNYPTQKGMLAGNPRDSAMAQINNTNAKQASLSASVGGKRKYHKKIGGATNAVIPVPQYQMQYTPQGGPGTDPNSQIQQNSQISTQGTANAVYDQEATKTGGKRSKKRFGGSNPNANLKWGCYSGGKKRKTKKSGKKIKKSKSNRKSRRH
jgi:hypothetical protein